VTFKVEVPSPGIGSIDPAGGVSSIEAHAASSVEKTARLISDRGAGVRMASPD
jgi:hypothetical protein